MNPDPRESASAPRATGDHEGRGDETARLRDEATALRRGVDALASQLRETEGSYGWLLAGKRSSVKALEFLARRRLPALLATFDVNLAPLELGDPFREAKSELKWVGAAAPQRLEADYHSNRHGEALATSPADLWRDLSGK